MPTTSVITPFLNAQRYLADAVESVCAQTMPDWELLLVDDASTDDSRTIAERFAARNDKIRIIDLGQEHPIGPAAARNHAAQQARGDFVVFLDADDILEPDSLRIQTEAMRLYPTAAMVYGATHWWYPDDESRDWTEPIAPAPRLHAPPKLLRDIILMRRGHAPCICSAMIRRGVFLDLGGFEEQFRLYEDQTLWVKVFLKYPVVELATRLAIYRQHAESTSAAAARSGEYAWRVPHKGRAAFVEWIALCLRRGGNNDSHLQRAMRLALAPYHPIPKARLFLDRVIAKGESALIRLGIRSSY
jgi:glycosyltransferase involved in cell wall biosynthesis